MVVSCMAHRGMIFMNNVLVTGGTGFIGRHLCRDLVADGWQVEVLTRNPAGAPGMLPEGVRAIGSLTEASDPRAVVNLAGENLAAGRWNEQRKREMRESRLRVTRQLVAFIGECAQPPEVLVSGSAVGYYGARGDDVLDENEPPGNEFQSELCLAWEQAAQRAEPDLRVCRIRTGIVLGAGEGALAKMLTPFKVGLGGHFGSGRQYMPWIHLQDEIRALRFLMDNPSCAGAFNLCAPNPVTNREFTWTLARALHRPSFAWVPGPLLRLMVGEMAHLLLTGQRAIPAALQAAGFEFQYPRLDEALAELLGAKSVAA